MFPLIFGNRAKKAPGGTAALESLYDLHALKIEDMEAI
jgi:hypothetical protein